jgi:hypothetical protein
MVDAADSPLDKAPESLNRIRVNIAHNVDFLSVLDALVSVAASL